MKTIDQFIEELKKSPVYKSGDDYLVKGSIEFAQRWIPFEEELPEINSRILLMNNKGNIDIRTIKSHSFRNGKLEIFFSRGYAIYWRPIELK